MQVPWRAEANAERENFQGKSSRNTGICVETARDDTKSGEEWAKRYFVLQKMESISIRYGMGI